MNRSYRGSEPNPDRHLRAGPGATEVAEGRRADVAGDAAVEDPEPIEGQPRDQVWFEVRAHDTILTGTSDRVVHRPLAPEGAPPLHEWRYHELRSLQVLDDGGTGGTIVIEPVRGPLVPISIRVSDREAAFQAATVFELLIARAQRAGGIRVGSRR